MPTFEPPSWSKQASPRRHWLALALFLSGTLLACGQDPAAFTPLLPSGVTPEAPEGGGSTTKGTGGLLTQVGPPACEDGWRFARQSAGELVLNVTSVVTLPRCAQVVFDAVVASGVTVALQVGALPPGSTLFALDSRSQVLGMQQADPVGSVLRVTTQTSGPLRFEIHRENAALSSSTSVLVQCEAGCAREATRYPIVLVHGAWGQESYLGVLTYFHNVKSHLRELGYDVYTPQTEFLGPADERAPILASHIDAILEQTGTDKVHLIGHSQGGLDMRVLVSGLGYADSVASMTTIGTPHRGVRINVPELFTGQDFYEATMLNDFAPRYPDVLSIPRFSWAGQTCGDLDLSCQDAHDGEWVIPFLEPSFKLIQAAHSDDAFGGANDGLVPVASAMWGTFLGVLAADHFDEVGQIATQGVTGPFDHLAFYTAEARRLRALEISQRDATTP